MWTFTNMDFLAFGGSYPSLFLMRLFQGKFDVLKFYRQFDISKSYLSDKKIQYAMKIPFFRKYFTHLPSFC